MRAARASGQWPDFIDYDDPIVQTDMRIYGPGDADAALIAAAPDMLDALKEIVGIWKDASYLEPADETIEKAYAAIAKAEGKA
jgi:hypothetical protein